VRYVPIVHANEYWISEQDSLERIRVRQLWPFARTYAHSIAAAGALQHNRPTASEHHAGSAAAQRL
jgi:hypothetical protein